MANVMKVILLERIPKLGQMGEVVSVRNGFGRNFLLPQGKALRATKANIAYFETQKDVLQERNRDRRTAAEAISRKLGGLTVAIVRQAAEGGQLYGSVVSRDIAEAVGSAGIEIERRMVELNQPIKTLGLFPVEVVLHPEVRVTVTVNVARSEDEAVIQQQRGGALVGLRDEDLDEYEEEDGDEAGEAEASADADGAEGDRAA